MHVRSRDTKLENLLLVSCQARWLLQQWLTRRLCTTCHCVAQAGSASCLPTCMPLCRTELHATLQS